MALSLQAAGGRCALAPAAQGVHEHSLTLGSGSSRKNFLMGFGRAYLLRKWSALTPRRLPAILAREVPICAGQLLLDRSAAGIRGRVAGMRAEVSPRPYPAGAVERSRSPGLLADLGRRARRRRRLRSGRAAA
jgi:hypothetical protein